MRWDFVARPTSTSNSPVANGSSVPAWPVRMPPNERRTAATTSWEVSPAGLSIKRTPSIGRGQPVGWADGSSGERRSRVPVGRDVQLRGDGGAQERDQLIQLERGREDRRAAVPAAPLRSGDDRYVDVVVGRPQRDFA